MGDVLNEFGLKYIEGEAIHEYEHLLEETVTFIKNFLIEVPIDTELEGFFDPVRFRYDISPSYYIRKERIKKIEGLI